ncbi:MAG: hypothetical protein ABSF53_12635 [Terracidiphilus sp.]
MKRLRFSGRAIIASNDKLAYGVFNFGYPNSSFSAYKAVNGVLYQNDQFYAVMPEGQQDGQGLDLCSVGRCCSTGV